MVPELRSQMVLQSVNKNHKLWREGNQTITSLGEQRSPGTKATEGLRRELFGGGGHGGESSKQIVKT